MLSEYDGLRVRVRPDLPNLEPFIREDLTGLQEREGPDATIVGAEPVSVELFFDRDIDNVPLKHWFKEKDCQFVEGTAS